MRYATFTQSSNRQELVLSLVVPQRSLTRTCCKSYSDWHGRTWAVLFATAVFEGGGAEEKRSMASWEVDSTDLGFSGYKHGAGGHRYGIPLE